MIVKKATSKDLPALRYLMQTYGKMTVDESLFNNKDIALQARADGGELAGFIWCGLMAKGTLGYVDKFVVNPDFSKKGVGNLLALHLLKETASRGIRRVIGVIENDQYHDKSAINALKMAMGAHKNLYTYVEADIQNTIEELKGLGENYGR